MTKNVFLFFAFWGLQTIVLRSRKSLNVGQDLVFSLSLQETVSETSQFAFSLPRSARKQIPRSAGLKILKKKYDFEIGGRQNLFRISKDESISGWLITNFRVFRGSFSELFWTVLVCFSDSFPPIFRPNYPSKSMENRYVTHSEPFRKAP